MLTERRTEPKKDTKLISRTETTKSLEKHRQRKQVKQAFTKHNIQNYKTTQALKSSGVISGTSDGKTHSAMRVSSTMLIIVT